MKKLVRDLIPVIIENQHKTPVCYIADDKEYKLSLKKKLKEEVDEFFEAESIEELADVLEVIEAIYPCFCWNKEEVEKARLEKKEQRGGFEKKIILLDIKDNSCCHH